MPLPKKGGTNKSDSHKHHTSIKYEISEDCIFNKLQVHKKRQCLCPVAHRLKLDYLFITVTIFDIYSVQRC